MYGVWGSRKRICNQFLPHYDRKKELVEEGERQVWDEMVVPCMTQGISATLHSSTITTCHFWFHFQREMLTSQTLKSSESCIQLLKYHTHTLLYTFSFKLYTGCWVGPWDRSVVMEVLFFPVFYHTHNSNTPWTNTDHWFYSRAHKLPVQKTWFKK